MNDLTVTLVILVLAFLIGFVYHSAMKQQINICTRNPQTGNLTIIKDNAWLSVDLNEETMTLYAIYKGRPYEVMGNIYLSYIVID